MKKLVKTVAVLLMLAMVAVLLPIGAGASEAKTHTLTIFGPEPGNQYIKYEDREEYEVWHALQDMLKENGLELKLETVPNDQYTATIQTRMASASLPDIVNVSAIDDASLVSMGQYGTILELSDAIAKYSNGNIERMYSKVYDTGYPLIKTEEGKIYWLTNLHKGNTFNDTEIPMGLGLQIRKDWLDKLGIPMPTTLDEFTAAIRAFREKDANGNGLQDEIILIDVQYFANGLAQVFGLGNGVTALDPVNGQIVSPWYQGNVKAYFTYVRGLIDEGLIDPATIGSWDLQNQRLSENLVGAWYAYDSATYLSDYVSGVEGVDYEPVFTLTGAVEGSEPWKEVENSQLVWARYCVTKNCTDIEGAIKFFDMICSDEYTAILSWGIEGKDYVETDGVRTSLINNMSNQQKAEARRTTGSPLWGELLPRVQIGTAFNTLEDWQKDQKDNGRKTDIQIDAMTKAIDYKSWCPLMLTNFLAMATDAETETINKVQTGIQTYSDELCMKLALGMSSIDDFDSYLAEMKLLGLDDLIAVQQARYERFMANRK